MNSILRCENLDESDAVIVSVGYDITASFKKGTVNGPKTVIDCFHKELEFFDRYSKTEPGFDFKFAHYNLGNLNNLESEEMVKKVQEEYKNLLLKEKFLLLIGGEHSVSVGALKAMSEVHNPKEVTILQIDAHPDLRNDDDDANPYDSTPNKFAHSCALRRAHEIGYSIVQVGIRAYSRDEYEYYQENKDSIIQFEWGLGEVPEIEEIISSIKTDKVYINIDVDGIDPSYMPATGTPVQGGLEWYYTINLIREIIDKKNVIGADIVEVAPRPDDVLTEYGAAQLAYNIISQQTIKTKRKSGQ